MPGWTESRTDRRTRAKLKAPNHEMAGHKTILKHQKKYKLYDWAIFNEHVQIMC